MLAVAEISMLVHVLEKPILFKLMFLVMILIRNGVWILFSLNKIYLFMYDCLPSCMLGAPLCSQKRAPDPLELEFSWLSVARLGLGTEPVSSLRTPSTLNC